VDIHIQSVDIHNVRQCPCRLLAPPSRNLQSDLTPAQNNLGLAPELWYLRVGPKSAF
jgi:hypothetical protein